MLKIIHLWFQSCTELRVIKRWWWVLCPKAGPDELSFLTYHRDLGSDINRGGFPLAFLCRQWNMNGLTRASHMNSHLLYHSLYKPKNYWMTEFTCCSSALMSHTKFQIRAFQLGFESGTFGLKAKHVTTRN